MEATIDRSQWSLPQNHRLLLGVLVTIVTICFLYLLLGYNIALSLVLGALVFFYILLFERPVWAVLGTIVPICFFKLILGYDTTLSLVLGAQIFLYILLFKRPVWAMAALIVGQITLPTYSYYLGEQRISVILSWSILTLLLLVPILIRNGGIRLGSGAGRVIIPAIILAGVAAISNFINIEQTFAVQYLRQEFSWLVILVLLPAAVKNEKDLKRLALVALIVSCVSAIFAMRQYFTPALWDDLEGRAVGLTVHPSHLGYTMPLILLPTIAMYFLKGVNSNARKLIVLLIIIMAVGLYLSFTRMGMYSLAAGLLLMVLLMKGKPKKELFLVVLIVGAAFFCYVNVEDNRYSQGFVGEEGTEGRLALWQAGVNIATDYPLLGIGSYRYEELSLAYAETINPSLIEEGSAASLGRHAAHNDFITVWASFGTVALLVYLWLLVGIFRNFVEASRHSRTRFLKAFTIGCFGTAVAYVVNSATHNILSPTMLLWIIGGLSIAATKVAASNRYSKLTEIP